MIRYDNTSVDCHEGCVVRVGSWFYWYGRSYRGNVRGIYGTEGAKFRCGVVCYKSTDLEMWEFVGDVLRYEDAERGDEFRWMVEGTWHRMRVVYHAKRQRYVMWFFVLEILDGQARVRDVVAEAERPEGPFVIVGETARGREVSGDLALWTEADGTGYVFNGDWKRSCWMARLNADYRGIEGEQVVVFPAGEGRVYEGICIAKYRGKYLAAASGVVGLNASETTYAVSDHVMGPWEVKGVMSEQETWGSQISSFFYLEESDCLIALCDCWLHDGRGNLVDAEQSAQLWLPVRFDPVSGVAKMEYLPQWDPFSF